MKVELIYNQTFDVHFTNDISWKERWKTESVLYGHYNIQATNIFHLIDEMRKLGYYKVPRRELKGTPFSSK